MQVARGSLTVVCVTKQADGRMAATHIPQEFADKIEVAYNAIDERLMSGPATEADRQSIAERYQVNYPFLLYAGSIRPHKNVGRVIEAVQVAQVCHYRHGRRP